MNLENPKVIFETVNNILKEKKIAQPPDLLFAQCAGSFAFNLNVEGSDFDWFGIYLGPADLMLGLERIPDSFMSKENSVDDYALYEVEKYCELLFKGNPKVIEPLFAPRLIYETPAFTELKKIRKSFLSQVTAQQYISYGINKLQSAKKEPEKAKKNAYHALRLLNEAQRIVDGKEPLVWIEGEEREHLLAIRRGEVDLDLVFKKCEELVNYCSNRISQLPADIDSKKLSAWLENLRLSKVISEIPKIDFLPVYSETQLELKKQGENVLNQKNISGTLLCVVPCGSFAYGTSVSANSIQDYIAIYVAPTRDVVSLFPPPVRVDSDPIQTSQKLTFIQGFVLFEVGFVAQQLCGGNHRFFELLFYDGNDSYESFTWQELKAQRMSLCGLSIINHIVGVTQGALQTAAYALPNEALKLKYQSVRLLSIAQDLLQNQSPKIFDLDPSQATLLKQIRLGEIDANPIISMLQNSINLLKKSSSIPSKSNKSFISSWLIKIRNGK